MGMDSGKVKFQLSRKWFNICDGSLFSIYDGRFFYVKPGQHRYMGCERRKGYGKNEFALMYIYQVLSGPRCMRV